MKKIPVKKYMYTNTFNGEIHKVEIQRRTDKSVVLWHGGTARIKTKDTIFCDTPEEAFEFHIDMLCGEVSRRKRAYLQYKKKYDKFMEKGMICK